MSSSHRPRILLIDDDDAVRSTLSHLLASDFHVTEEVDGVAGIERLMAEVFDAVVTDLEMPRACGDTVVTWLEANRPTLAARVIVLSGGARDPKRAEWLASFDTARVFEKPCSIDALVNGIRRVLG
jgi:CheY-like chemotaxis protein